MKEFVYVYINTMVGISNNKRTWTCICGAIHFITEKPIFCSGKGHSVQIMPAYFQGIIATNEDTPKSTVKKGEVQQSLF